MAEPYVTCEGAKLKSLSKAECTAALPTIIKEGIKGVNTNSTVTVEGPFTNFPPACYVGVTGGTKGVFFNEATKGDTNGSSRAVCKA